MSAAIETADAESLIQQLQSVGARLGRGYTELNSGNYKAAYETFHALWEETTQALDAFAGVPDWRSADFRRSCMIEAAPVGPYLIDTLISLGLAAGAVARWAEAEEAYAGALSYFGEPPDPSSALQRAFALNGLGDALFFQASFARAESRYQEAADLFLAVGNAQMAVQAVAKSADCARSRADAESFFLRTDRAIELARAHGLSDLERSQRERAELFRRGLGASGESAATGGPSEAPAAASEESADSHLAMAKELWTRGDAEGSKRALRDALAAPEIKSDPRKHFFALVDLADLCADGKKDRKPADKSKRLAEGIAAVDAALAMTGEMLLAEDLARIALKTLLILLHQSDDPAHSSHARQELDRLCGMGPSEEAVASLLDRAGHSLDRGDHPAALADLDRAEPLVTTPVWRRIVDLARIATLAKCQGRAHEALQKSLAVLGPGGSFYAENLTDEGDLTAWRSQLNSLETLQGNAAVLLAREGRVAEAFQHVENAKARRLRAVMAAQGARADGPTVSVGLDELAAVLREENAVMALLWIGASEIFVLTVDPWTGAPQAHFVPVAARELRAKINTLRDKALSEDQVRELSALLVPALREVVDRCRANGGTLYLAADAELFAVPFAALWWDEAAGTTIAHQCALACVPSATLWCWLRARRGELAQRNCLVAVTGATQAADGGAISFEPQAREVAALLGAAEVMVDPSKAAFLAAARTPTVIHLESHGRFDAAAAGALSSSYLSFPGDESLTAHEIAESLAGRAPAELVFLNACLSGRFSLRVRSEVAGLCEAFLRTGALSIVGNLLSVDPTAAAAVAAGFYRHWLGGDISKAEALRRAQLDVRQTMPAPEKWATHILIGLHN